MNQHRLPLQYWKGRIDAMTADLLAAENARRTPAQIADVEALRKYLDWLKARVILAGGGRSAAILAG